MRLSGTLRHAEQEGARAVHRGAELVSKGIHNVEANLRKLRSSHKKTAAKLPSSAYPDPEQETASPNSKARTGIVSVNGKDVGEMRCTGGRS